LFSPSLSVRDKGPSTAASANSPQARPAGVPFTVDSGASPSPSRSRAAGKKYRDSTLITVCLPLISPANSSRGRLPGWMDGGGGGEGIESSCFGVRRRHPPAISATLETHRRLRARERVGVPRVAAPPRVSSSLGRRCTRVHLCLVLACSLSTFCLASVLLRLNITNRLADCARVAAEEFQGGVMCAEGYARRKITV